MDKETWIFRYKERFVKAGLSPWQAQKFVETTDIEEARASFEDDPEAAAEEEMSYWAP